MGLKERVKKELGYMKKGAKVLPTVAAKKVTGYVSGQFQAAKQQALLEKEARVAAKIEADKAYREEFIAREKEKAVAKARARAAGKGGLSGILGELGRAGERMSVADMLGMPNQQGTSVGGAGEFIMPTGSRGQGTPRGDIDTGGYIMSGLPRRQVQSRRQDKRKHHHSQNRGRR